MLKPCIICGQPVLVEHESEIVTCSSDYCILTVENSIGLHYLVGETAIQKRRRIQDRVAGIIFGFPIVKTFSTRTNA